MNGAEQILVNELRSGKYAQATDKLEINMFGGGEAYCCLGVACLVLGEGSFDKEGYYNTTDGAHDLFLPLPVRDKLDWRTYRGLLTFLDRDFEQVSLDKLNDTGFSFAQIADIIAADLVQHQWKEDEESI